MLSSTMRKRWQRLATMNRAELTDRTRQELSKRLDGLLYHAGANFSRDETKATTQLGRFFFAPEQVPALIALLRERFPAQVKEIVRSAERICQHRFDLLGYENCNYGIEIDWHSDVVHGKRAPLRPWYKIRYLDFNQVGDSKITWELNRHQHLVTLAKAYRLTGDERFGKEIFAQWKHWHRHNPYPIGINWASSLEVSFRSLSWLWTYFLLEETPAMPKDFRSEWLNALAISGRHIDRYLSTYFSPNTHLLGEGVGLFFIGMMCPQLKPAQRWKQRGWEIVLHAAEQHVQSDGFYFEQSTYYHIYALDFFIHAAVLASKNDVSIPKEFDCTLEKMLDMLCRLSHAGPPPRFGDDDGGRVFDQRRNRTEHLRDPLATGAVLFGRSDFKRAAAGLREETIWLLGEQGVAEFDRLPSAESGLASARSNEKPTSGLYVMEDAETKQQLNIDAGPQGSLAAGHGHADALSVTMNRDGQALLIDSGTLEYVGNGAERNLLRGTSAHNTLMIDGLSQSEPKGAFAWEKLPNVKAEKWINGETFDLFVGSHDGYGRLPNPVLHRRWVVSLKSHFCLIRDLIVGEGEHKVDLFWHLNPELSRRQTPTDLADTFISAKSNNGIALLVAEHHGWSRRNASSDWSPVYGKKETHPVLHFGTQGALPLEFATLLVTDAAKFSSPGKFWRVERSSPLEKVQEYCYEDGGETHHLFFSDGQPWMKGEWRSDAEFLYWREGSGADSTLICCNCTYVELNGTRLISRDRPITRCEIITRREHMDVFPKEQEASLNKTTVLNALRDRAPALVGSTEVSAHDYSQRGKRF